MKGDDQTSTNDASMGRGGYNWAIQTYRTLKSSPPLSISKISSSSPLPRWGEADTIEPASMNEAGPPLRPNFDALAISPSTFLQHCSTSPISLPLHFPIYHTAGRGKTPQAEIFWIFWFDYSTHHQRLAWSLDSGTYLTCWWEDRQGQDRQKKWAHAQIGCTFTHREGWDLLLWFDGLEGVSGV